MSDLTAWLTRAVNEAQTIHLTRVEFAIRSALRQGAPFVDLVSLPGTAHVLRLLSWSSNPAPGTRVRYLLDEETRAGYTLLAVDRSWVGANTASSTRTP